VDPDVYTFAVVAAVVAGFIGSMAVIFVGTRIALQRTRPQPLARVNDERFDRLEQAVDAIAIEIERMSEAQRFTAKLLTERAAQPAALPAKVGDKS
jgi:hypothetical protein